jgi:hypothetical protein
VTACKGGVEEPIRWDAICTSEPIWGTQVYVDHVSGPDATPRGYFDWKVKFELEPFAHTDGWIIQEIKQEITVNYASGTKSGFPVEDIPRPVHFFEAWGPVKKGEKHKRMTAHPYDDRFLWDTEFYTSDDTTGRVVNRGIVKFYPEKFLPPTFAVGNAPVPSVLPSSREAPPGWDNLKGTEHILEMEWDGQSARGRMVRGSYEHTFEIFADG